MKKQIELRRKFVKKAVTLNKEKTVEIINTVKNLIYLDEETHWDNGETEIIVRIVIPDNNN